MNPKINTVKELEEKRKNVHMGSCKLMQSKLKAEIEKKASDIRVQQSFLLDFLLDVATDQITADHLICWQKSLENESQGVFWFLLDGQLISPSDYIEMLANTDTTNQVACCEVACISQSCFIASLKHI